MKETHTCHVGTWLGHGSCCMREMDGITYKRMGHMNGALRLSTPHFAKAVQLWVSLIPLKLERL